ncbi:hypothetical protein [Paenibacillus motobuensis]|uniref:Butirosin biosynthesis protein H N-terminal domain-containing protein n=1 Tax=Paenibacillus motobuensis TaxID=295324 RepID=A0ABP3HWN4_9BACL
MNRLIAIMANSSAMPWYINNFIPQVMYDNFNIHCYDTDNTYEVFSIYDEAAELNNFKFDDNVQTIVNLLNNNEYVLVHWDRFYVKQTTDYLCNHEYHEALIYGYDSDKRVFYFHDSLINNKDYDIDEISYDDICLSLKDSIIRTQELEATHWQFAFGHPFSSFSIRSNLPEINLRKIYHDFYTQLRGSEIEFNYEGGEKRKYYNGMMIFNGLELLLETLEKNITLTDFTQGIWSIKLMSQHVKSHTIRFKYLIDNGYFSNDQEIFNQIDRVSSKLLILFSLISKYTMTHISRDLIRCREQLLVIKEEYFNLLSRATNLIETTMKK